MGENDFAYSITLSTFGVTSDMFEKACATIRTDKVDAQFEEQNLQGKIILGKNCVDDVALENAIAKMIIELGENIYAEDDRSLAQCLVDKLLSEGEKVAVAESVTGGMLSSAICSIDGASQVFYEGIISYDSASKVRRLHVPATVIQEHTAVSSEVCEAMLKGVLANKEVKYGIVTTGYATSKDPDLCGKAFVGYGTSNKHCVVEVKYDGSRNDIREKITNFALFSLLTTIKENKRKY